MCLFKVGLIMDRTSEGSGASPALSGIVIMRRWSLNPPNPPLTKGGEGGFCKEIWKSRWSSVKYQLI